jgi:hypothetical protein
MKTPFLTAWGFVPCLLLTFLGCDRSIDLSRDNGLVAPRQVEVAASTISTTEVVFPVPFTNSTDRNIKVVGMTSDCSCTESKLPCVIPARETAKLEVRVATGSGNRKGSKKHRRVLFVQERSRAGLSVDLITCFKE